MPYDNLIAALKTAAVNRLGESLADSDTAPLFARLTDAASFVLSHANLAPELRGFADGLIGISGGQDDWFAASDEFIGARIGRSSKTVQRMRAAFLKWQRTSGKALVEIEDATFDPKTKIKTPHKYRVHNLLQTILDTLEIAQASRAWHAKPSAALAHAAEQTYAALRSGNGHRQHKRRERDAQTELGRHLRTAATLLAKVCKIVDGLKLNSELGGQMAQVTVRGDLLADIEAQLATLREAAAENLSSKSTDILDTPNEPPQGRDTGGQASDIPPCVPIVEARAGQAVMSARPTDPSGHFVHYPPAETPVNEPLPEVCADEAVACLRVFQSVGADAFTLCLRDEATGEPADKSLPKRGAVAVVERLMRTGFLDASASRYAEVSAIVRPYGVGLVQADDLSAAMLARVAPFAFVAVETSAGNYQAWLKIDGDEATRETTRRRLLLALGADVGANGAMRWPGSLNRKLGRGAWRVRMTATQAGRITSAAELESAGLLAELPAPMPAPAAMAGGVARGRGFAGKWPDYGIELSKWPDDRSRADFSWATIAAKRGFGEAETISQLMSESEKAQQSGQRYAERTVRRAFAVV